MLIAAYLFKGFIRYNARTIIYLTQKQTFSGSCAACCYALLPVQHLLKLGGRELTATHIEQGTYH